MIKKSDEFKIERKRFSCNQIKDACVTCGDCCRRYPMILHPEDERILKEKIYKSKGIIYLYPFAEFGLPFKSDEVERFKKIADEKGVNYSFKPLKIIIKNKKPIVIDYFLDLDACPFLIDNKCTIYDRRFSVCRAFPDISLFPNDFSFDFDKNLSYEDALKIAKTVQKKI